MQIEGIEIKNYRLFRNLSLSNLPRMTVVVGANGSGKTMLFDVFTFLKDALTENGLQRSLVEVVFVNCSAETQQDQ